MELIERFLTPNPYSRCGVAMERPRGLVYHYTGKAGQDAAGCWRYFEDLKDQVPDEKGKVPRKASSHFIIDQGGTVLQLMPIPDPSTGKNGEVAFHAGPQADTIPAALERFGSFPNAVLFGIEMCHVDWPGRFTSATLEAARELGARLCEMYNLSPDEDVLRHHDITGKLCPRWFVEHPADWVEFRQSIKQRMLEVVCSGTKNGDC